ncbi:hypothetical protein [Breznakiella homolactica]|uniref:Uncharacterized protein n=1 Tax=Breznakiella homolactica TaxID=2798577 RepID=A0A7T8BBG7_9SPIR|nr:hypothetical protein [Breznakiella homolactica]QQO10010.1 hypothetical protein JFL75_03595 [Breznakiella homolactica]
MKQAVFGLIIVVCFLSGCASMGKPKDMSGYAPVGIVAVTSNYDILWVGEQARSSSKGVETVRNTLGLSADKEDVYNSDAENLINEAETILRSLLSHSGIGEFADKNTVINSRSYQNAELDSRAVKNNDTAAEGYKLINSGDKQLAADLAAETGIGSSMFVRFNFSKDLSSGIGKTGTMRAIVTMAVTIISADGKTVYKKSGDYTSRAKISVSGGAYDNDELMDLFYATISDACYDFTDQFTQQ